MTEKEEFAEYTRRAMTLAAQACEAGAKMMSVYTSRGYSTLTDQEIENLGITKLDIDNSKYFFENYFKMAHNTGVPDAANYWATLDIMRNDIK